MSSSESNNTFPENQNLPNTELCELMALCTTTDDAYDLLFSPASPELLAAATKDFMAARTTLSAAELDAATSLACMEATNPDLEDYHGINSAKGFMTQLLRETTIAPTSALSTEEKQRLIDDGSWMILQLTDDETNTKQLAEHYCDITGWLTMSLQDKLDNFNPERAKKDDLDRLYESGKALHVRDAINSDHLQQIAYQICQLHIGKPRDSVDANQLDHEYANDALGTRSETVGTPAVDAVLDYISQKQQMKEARIADVEFDDDNTLLKELLTQLFDKSMAISTGVAEKMSEEAIERMTTIDVGDPAPLYALMTSILEPLVCGPMSQLNSKQREAVLSKLMWTIRESFTDYDTYAEFADMTVRKLQAGLIGSVSNWCDRLEDMTADGQTGDNIASRQRISLQCATRALVAAEYLSPEVADSISQTLTTLPKNTQWRTPPGFNMPPTPPLES